MTAFFKRIRKHLLSEKSFKNYLGYALGEIVLVVIGILIAIQINDWNHQRAEERLEVKYLDNLLTELKQDSLGLRHNYQKLQDQARTKNQLLDMIKEGIQGDSMLIYFDYQWRQIQPYIPIRSTYIEMSENAHLKIIKDDQLREKIIKFYNAYDVLEKEEDFFVESSTINVMNRVAESIPDLSNYNIDDVMALRSDRLLLNMIQLNGAYTRRDNYQKILKACSDLISDISVYREKGS